MDVTLTQTPPISIGRYGQAGEARMNVTDTDGSH